MPFDRRTFWIYFAAKHPEQDAAYRALARLSPAKRQATLMEWLLRGWTAARRRQSRGRRTNARPALAAPSAPPADVDDVLLGIRDRPPQRPLTTVPLPLEPRKDSKT